MDESPKKNNLSFSFTFDSVDLDNVDSDHSSDSETNGLQIDVSEVDHFNDTDKPRRQDVDETFFINEMEEEIERQLDAKAAKTKLTATNVKNILKHVISNEHVMAMVHKKLTKGDSDVVFEPKLTRAKAKELALHQPDVIWPMTPVKNTTSEAQILIEKEYSEDSSDEEYQPDQDQQSDDEKEVDSSTGNDIDSMPSTPATPGDPSLSLEIPGTPEIQYDTEEGVFKVPLTIPNAPTEEESIGHRTRSKLSLKETPVEQIEQAFIPPDITNDMYDWDYDPGDDYIGFLNELYFQPLAKEVTIEDDTEADPEYNILEDEDTELLDKEELREDRAVKVSKRELKTLMAELEEYADQYSGQQEQQNEQQWQQQQFQQQLFQQHDQMQLPRQQSQDSQKSRKRKTPENSFELVQQPPPPNTMIELIPVLSEPELPKLVNPNQLYLLSIQISQHIQLLAQQFVMTYKHPKLHKVATESKSYLNSLKQLAWGEKSEFNAKNLNDALTLVSDWETKLSDQSFFEDYNHFIIHQLEMEEQFFNSRRKYKPEFHPEMIRIMASSKALMHPHLLPDLFPCALHAETGDSNSIYNKNKIKYPYLLSEEHLMALGLEQFLPHIQSIKKKFNRNCDKLADTAKEIKRYLLPTRDVVGLMHHIKKRKQSKEPNPIKHYFTTKAAPLVQHRLLNEYKAIAPIDRPAEFLSPIWRTFKIKLDTGFDLEVLSMQPNKAASKNLDLEVLSMQPNKAASKNLDLEVLSMQPNKAASKKNDFSIISIEDILSQKEPEIISHELRNPIVNMLHMPALITPQKDDAAASTSKGSSSRIKSLRKASEVESDAESAESIRTCETDEEESRPTRLRMTTPRLAKIKSAQNMKLLAQTLSSKGSTSASHSNENKEDSPDKNDDNASSFTKGDNEDEIAELMLASTTIKKNTTSRKKTKQARELENLKRLLEAENNVNEDERATKFAASFIQKIHVKLESKDPELFKILLKIFLDYSEKIENSPETGEDDLQNKNPSSSTQNVEKNDEYRDKLSVELYQEVCDKLYEYPDLCSDFLLFLTPNQAALIDKSVEHTMMLKMKEFINVTQMYFAKQPSRIAKVMQAITQMASDPYITVESAQTIMGTALKGHPLIMDMFLQVIPAGKPPDSLFAAHMFENLACPVGPHDKNKAYDVDAPELYENIELPASTPQEDPYGGDSCKCECHSIVDDLKLKGINEHCASCGTRFLNGRIYLQTSEGLRPAKITFPGADDEKLENISRVSLKTNEKIVPCPPEKKRRKSTKRDSISEESTVKGFATKVSPSKENEDSDRLISKSRKSTKFPTKSTESKKLSKVPSNSVKTKREKKAEKKIKSDFKTEDDQNEYCVSGEQTEFDEGNASNTNDDYAEDMLSNKLGEISTDSHEDDASTSPEKVETFSTNIKKMEVSSDSDNSTTVDAEKTYSDLPWSMQDDRVLLEHVQKDYSEKTFHTVSLLLKNRTVEQVKERCQYLLSLIEKMV